MPVLEITYICQECGKESSENNRGMICEYCFGHLRGEGAPGIHGTRDSFGIKNSFKDDSTGKEIDNWKTWEKAGYRDALSFTKNSDMKKKIKDNIKKRRNV